MLDLSAIALVKNLYFSPPKVSKSMFCCYLQQFGHFLGPSRPQKDIVIRQRTKTSNQALGLVEYRLSIAEYRLSIIEYRSNIVRMAL